jgi:hypothetical protein
VKAAFGIRGLRVEAFEDPKLSKPISGAGKSVTLAGKTLFIKSLNSQVEGLKESGVKTPMCHFVNVECSSKKATLLLENPRGCPCTASELLDQVTLVWGF